jgi:anaerobic ribonucleoside-triphosphate reductase activating protein
MTRNMPLRVNVGAWEPRSVANGPGERFVLWVQGCPRRCSGCFNQELLPFVDKDWIGVKELASLVRSAGDIEGITLSGGEPMSQATALAELTSELRRDGLGVVCYTGYTLAELGRSANPWVHRLLANVDMLVDGPYEERSRINAKWRGSANQRVHFLTERYAYLRPQASEREAEVEFVVGPDGFMTTGTPSENLIASIEEALRKHAI